MRISEKIKRFPWIVPSLYLFVLAFFVIWNTLIVHIPIKKCEFEVAVIPTCTIQDIVTEPCIWGEFPLVCTATDEKLVLMLNYPGETILKALGVQAWDNFLFLVISNVTFYYGVGLFITAVKKIK